MECCCETWNIGSPIERLPQIKCLHCENRTEIMNCWAPSTKYSTTCLIKPPDGNGATEEPLFICSVCRFGSSKEEIRCSTIESQLGSDAHTRVTNWASTNVSHSSIRNLEEFLHCTTNCCKSGVFAHAIVMGRRLVIFGQHLLSIQGVTICCCWLQARTIDSVVCCNTGAVHRAGPAPCSRHSQTEEILGPVVIKWCAASFY